MSDASQGRASASPTEVQRHIAASADAVFAAMSDAWMFPVWVVGATHVRGVDPDWPAPGSRMYHQVGPWPISVADHTTVLECTEPHGLVLQARAYPLGQVRIELTVEPSGTGSLVRMTETPTHGLARAIDNPVQRRLLAARNRECLARLAAIAENRTDPAAGVPSPSGRSARTGRRSRGGAATRFGQRG